LRLVGIHHLWPLIEIASAASAEVPRHVPVRSSCWCVEIVFVYRAGAARLPQATIIPGLAVEAPTLT
jgi:hypothetical protein